MSQTVRPSRPVSEFPKQKSVVGGSRTTPVPILRAETNFLRFPLFALGSKNLKQIDYREVKGTRTIEDRGVKQQVEFTYRVSRNTDHCFPGPQARKVHFALLALLQKQNHPFQNPIRFKWRELAREMGVSFSGSTCINQFKQAIRSIHGVIIRSDHALVDGESRKSFQRERGFGIYQQYVFQSELKPDGEVADANYVWLSDWYLDNLNAFYSVALDYGVWKNLNDRSPIASRLYEFTTFLLCKDGQRQIGYTKLARSLPVKEVRYESDVKKQLQPAFELLKQQGIISDIQWKRGVKNDIQLVISRGSQTKTSPLADRLDESEQITETTESRETLVPSERIIRQFYKLRFGIDEHLVTPREREFIEPFLEKFGCETLERILPKVVAKLKTEFPSAQSICAAQVAFEQYGEKVRQRTVVQPARQNEEPIADQSEDRQARRAQLRHVWSSLEEKERSEITEVVKSRFANLRNNQKLIDAQCLLELSHRINQGSVLNEQ